MTDTIRHEHVLSDGVSLHVVRSGEGPPVVLLHGFPEGWRAWRYQIPALAGAGFSVSAPDLRGYGQSGRPTETSAYHLRHLVSDVAAVVRATGHTRAHLVGHDWGGIVAWTFAGTHPELVDRLVILNAPHLDIYRQRLMRPSRQWLRAWYVVLFRLPHVPDRMLAAGDFHLLRQLFRRAERHAYSERDIDEYIEALAAPGALKAALDWYRANAAPDAQEMARSARAHCPTLVIWGERDRALGVELLDGLERVARRLTIHRIPHASHWVQTEAAEEVNRVLIDFLSASRAA